LCELAWNKKGKNIKMNNLPDISDLEKLTHSDLLSVLETLRKNKEISVRKIGTSVEGRAIYSLKFGFGKRRVLAWTQMHGDEHVSSLATLDFINYLLLPENREFKKEVFSSLTIELIPLLNPDGAEKNIRYNSLGIDINRDAQMLVSPEAKILNKRFKSFNPHFSLNLHDQDCTHTVGNTKEPVWLSFLATVGNQKKTASLQRKKSMSVIGETVTELKKIGIKNITRYNDEFEPRAFGDNFVKQGSSVILLEAGCIEKNGTKELERKIFKTALTTVIKKIAGFKVNSEMIDVYNILPENKDRMLDTKINNVIVNNKFRISLGIKDGVIEEIGDLSIYGAYENLDAQGALIKEVKQPGQSADFTLTDKKGNEILKCKKGKIIWAK
jgi:hypothetical protein